MLNLAMLMLSVGYGVGFEGYSNGKVYIGLYTPSAEYGYIGKAS